MIISKILEKINDLRKVRRVFFIVFATIGNSNATRQQIIFDNTYLTFNTNAEFWYNYLVYLFQIVQTVMLVFVSGYPDTIIHDPGDTLIPAPGDTGHCTAEGHIITIQQHHLYNSVSSASEDVPMGGGGLQKCPPINDCFGSLQYCVAVCP